MTKPRAMRGLSDDELAATIESLPDGLALFDAAGRLTWANRRGRRLLALHATTTPAVGVGRELEALLTELIRALMPFRRDEYARWAVSEGGTVDVALRFWGAQIAVRLSAPADLVRDEAPATRVPEVAPFQLIIIERVLDEADVGLAVASAGGRIRWMNRQARRLLGSAPQQRGAERDVVRAARHVAAGELAAPIRTRVQLPTRAVEAHLWSVAPGLAGVIFDERDEAWQGTHSESLIA